ncbi:LysR substrate-binding domain-containing protein [Pseudomonas shirazensis]|jgi:LysR family glycine cleavage system transcriptional activator|uniref:Glycine cleavage system transcriptional activator n=2 Tax=Pseudomonas TaxID=286 RepID=A0A5E6P6E3_PSEFL|nr:MULTISPECIES: LysR substrate-binding domain-containing protein [Pseudomonas]AUF96442.1 LysR family transcriptional regulator [Pseudomonas sp. 02C 26]MBA1320945.1 LysR family transcriptional regulator [Pseudomonas plecoglossicida]MBO0369475.1 LysR family transcriptional regulator [Pseudomonas putida]MBV4499990.1 LysR family transcriptional regulator [Pseudomonas shirazensis]MCS4282743.1 LysR family glycine cleavage system transcriptional activator [Pseudomonas sp. BIGb0278]
MRRQITGQFYVWLHVFSCAARHLSFTRCAEELHITPGAVSQQMRQLEEHLGYRLFLRKARGVELCAEGQRLALTVAEAYGSIEAELLRLDAGDIRGTLRLRSIPSFLAKWLTPRLPRFQQRYPDLELRLVAEDSNQALHPDDFDLAIDLNDGSYPGMLSTPLLDEQIFPVCSPALLRGRPPLHGPADLVHYPLLHDMTAWRGSSEYAEWEFYLQGIGAGELNVRRGHTFNRNHLTIEAAIAGVGVAIARRTLLNDELERGALIVPFGVALANHKRYVLHYPPGGLNQPGARAVHDWLVEEAQAFRALHPLALDV